MKKTVGVIAGGYSSEDHISLESADTVIAQITGDNYIIYKLIISKDAWQCDVNGKTYDINRADFTVQVGTDTIKFDCIFNAIHGEPGEGGQIQKYFKEIGMPFTASGHIASPLSFDKAAAKETLMKVDVVMPSVITITKTDINNLNTIAKDVKYPCIVKPNSSGSSYGVSKVNSAEGFEGAAIEAFKYNDLVLIEQFISGVELSCGVIEFGGKVMALPVTEIVFEGEIFDVEAKYSDNGADEITPARISANATEKCQRTTEKVFKELNLTDMASVDFILMDEEVYFIEANTIPGLSKNSILPKQLKTAGIQMGDLFTKMIERASCRG